MIVIDTNVFVIDLRYPRDASAAENRRFLDMVAQRGDGATSLVNLMELAGILGFGLSERQLHELVATFASRYTVRVLPPPSPDAELPLPPVSAVLDRLARKLAFGDALVLLAAERLAAVDATFVSWDARHFEGRTWMQVMTPAQWLGLSVTAPPTP